MSMHEIIEECKTFYLAGHETSSQFLIWTMFLLSTHPEWQEKLREEVLRDCGKETPVDNMLNKLKLVNMFILETLRLYSPIARIQRRASSAASRCPNARSCRFPSRRYTATRMSGVRTPTSSILRRSRMG